MSEGTTMWVFFLRPEGVAYVGIVKCGRITGEMACVESGEIIPGNRCQNSDLLECESRSGRTDMRA